MKFTKLHIPLIGILIFFVIARNVNNSVIQSILMICFLIIALIAEILVYKKFILNNYKFLVILRYYELCVTSICFTLVEYIYYMAIIVLAFLLLYTEFLTLFDYSDHYVRTISTMVASTPVLLGVSIHTYLNNKIDEILIIQFGIAITTVFIITYIGSLAQKGICDIEKRLFSQNRLLSNLNDINEALRVHQERVKRANEELGYQKIMLEAAYKKINCVNKEILIQNQIVKYISSSLEIGKLMSLITDSIFNEMDLDICAISLNAYVVDNKKMQYKIRTSFTDKYVKELSDRIEEDCIRPYLINNKSFVDNHVEENKYSFAKSIHIGSILIVPLIHDEIQIGFIFVGNTKYEAFVENTEFYEVIVAQFLIALNNANLYSRMEDMANHDTLTGIYNRGYLAKLLHEYLSEAIINKSSLTLALFDIDKFKNINDTYGHLFGDVIIKTIATMADKMVKENNGIVARYGGEEFVVAFPNKGLKEAFELVKQLHTDIKEKEVSHNGQVVHVYVSVGVTSYPETCKNPSDLLNRADWAMYYSKQNGRDKITIDSNEILEKVMMQ